MVDGYVDLGFLDAVAPFTSAFAPVWIGLGAVAVDLMLAVVITSALRRRMPPTLWRIVHLSAYAMWPVAVLHGWGTSGGDRSAGWMIAVNVACIAAVLVALGYRLTRPKSVDRLVRAAAARSLAGARR